MEISVHVDIRNIQIGTGTSGGSDDADFIADVTFRYKGVEQFKFEKIFFDNSVYQTAEKTEYSVLMFYDENTRLQQDYDEILMTSDAASIGDTEDFDFKLPEHDGSVGISFTRREPI